MPSGTPGPTTQSERIVSLDVLRGFAVLGILVMNIQSFSMIGAAYFNPTAYGDLTGLNRVIWLLSHILADMKFMTIFSMLFGAGIVLMAERMAASGRRPAGIHYRRMGILLLFGIAHGWILWTGDILYAYALCGFGVYLFRKKSPRTLLLLGLALLVVGSALSLLSQLSIPNWPEEQLLGMKEMWAPTAAQIDAEMSALRGGWGAQMEHRIPNVIMMETFVFLFNMVWRAGGVMLLGMALYKWGVFGAGLPARVYRRMVAAAFFLGLPLILLGVWYQTSTGWILEKGFFGGLQFNYWGSLPMALGWVGAVMLFCQAATGSRLHRALAATGRMAFTNYITQTVLCTFIFYGHGLGLFGRVDRTGQILIVFGIWALQLTWSPWWLARFRLGPLEWLWRALTYLRFPKFRREEGLAPGS